MRPQIARWLGLEPEDEAVVARLLGPFAAAAAAATVVATGTKAAFLAIHPIGRLPWVFAAQAAWAIATALLFARVLRRASVERRVAISLGLAAAVLVALWLVVGVRPGGGSFAAILIGPAAVQLALAQVWGTPTALLPSRQARRALPILASVSTAGAAAGGLVAGLLGRVVSADDLLVATSLLLVGAAAGLRSALRHLPRSDEADARGAAGADVSVRDVARLPLVARLAAVVALVQAGSVVLDVQLSGELSRTFDRDGMATFLGVFYGVTNAVTLLVGMGATSRLIRAVGLGLCVACTAVAHLAGSAGYLALALSGAAPALLALVAASALERVGQYAVGRTALALALAPLDAARQAVARTLVETVAYRAATLLAAASLLLIGDTPLHALAPWTIALALLALSLAVGVGARYRRALYEALGRGRIDHVGWSRVVVDDAVVRDVERALASGDADEIAKGLEVVRSLGIPLPDATLVRLASSADPRIAPRALDVFEALDRPIPEAVFRAQLEADRPLPVLRAALASVPSDAPAAVRALARGLVDHPDACVARLARVAAAIDGGAGGRPFRSMLAHGGRETRLFAIDALGQARREGTEHELLAMLEQADVRPRAAAALARFGATLAPIAERALAAGTLGHEARVALLGALERTGAARCRDQLVAVAAGPDRRLRDVAVGALFRMARDPAIAPSPSWLRGRALAEIAELASLWRLDVDGGGARGELVRAEVEERRLRTERRCLLLLALLYGRRPLHRAAVQARSRSARARSTAVELLDQHVKDPALRAIVGLVERGRASEAAASASLDLLDDDAWLARLRAWAERGEEDPGLEAIARMRRVPLLAELGGEALEPLSTTAAVRQVPAGDHLCRAGAIPDALFVVLTGRLRVEVPHAPHVGPGECVGELGLVDRAPRSADVVAVEATEVAVLEAAAFDDHLAAHPTFARGLLHLLAQRFRAAVERPVTPSVAPPPAAEGA